MDKNKLIRRLKIIEGQIRGLQQMIERDTYCIDVITQIEASKEALSSVARVMLESHLAKHVIHQMKMGEEKKAMNEILKVYKLAQQKK